MAMADMRLKTVGLCISTKPTAVYMHMFVHIYICIYMFILMYIYIYISYTYIYTYIYVYIGRHTVLIESSIEDMAKIFTKKLAAGRSNATIYYDEDSESCIVRDVK